MKLKVNKGSSFGEGLGYTLMILAAGIFAFLFLIGIRIALDPNSSIIISR